MLSIAIADQASFERLDKVLRKRIEADTLGAAHVRWRLEGEKTYTAAGAGTAAAGAWLFGIGAVPGC